MERHKLSTDVTYTDRNSEVSDVYHFGILHVSNLLLLLHHIDFLILLWHYIFSVDGYIKTYALRYNRFGMKMVQMGRLTLPTTVLILLVQLKMDN